MIPVNRRGFVSFAGGTAVGLLTNLRHHPSQLMPQSKTRTICAFVKFIQALSYEELAETMAELGFQGIEATIRPGGWIEPENVPNELPKLVKALERRNLEISVMTTGIRSVEDPHAQVILKSASDLGIKRYRMGYYRYDLRQPILPQLEALRPTVDALSKMNEATGISAIYQNHTGAQYIGSTIWDLHRLLEDIDPQQIGVAFDIRHACVSGGPSWQILWDVIKSHVQAVYFKDFRWNDRKIENVPLGDGSIAPEFYRVVSDLDVDLPISLHVEYLQKAGLKKNIKALGQDLKRLRERLER